MVKNKSPDIGDIVEFKIGNKQIYGAVACKYTNGEWGAIIPNGFISQGSRYKYSYTGKHISFKPMYDVIERIGGI